MMKTILSLLVVAALFICATSNNSVTTNKFKGTYDGLTENMDFSFTDEDGETMLFQEFDENVDYDLYEEEFVGQKFEVTWEEREVTVDEDEGDDSETGNSTIKVITNLKKL